MTAAIIPFPTMHERNDREFERTGETSYTRAVDEAHELARLFDDGSSCQSALANRLLALDAAILGLATWRHEVDWTLPIQLQCGRVKHIRLRDMTRYLYGLMSPPTPLSA